MRSNTYKNYLLIVLMVILAFSYVDRMIFGLVLDGIKTELRLTDTQMGLLSGIGFALFFALMGVPIARWADRGNRVTIIALTTGLWSVAVSLCGLAGSFLQLFLVRIGIAVGESGCGPPAHSLIPEYFSRAERARAMARYMLGVPIGLTSGYFVGGWLNELYGWRTTFIIIGLPGLVLASLAAFTLREPRRLAEAAPAASAQPATTNRASFRDVAVVLWSRSTFRHLLLAFLTWYFFGWGLVQWMPTFFIRSHGTPSVELGTWMAITHGAAGLLGTWLGGEWVSRYAARNECLQLVGLAAIFLLYAVFSATVHVVPNHHWAFAVFALANIVSFTAGGPVFAMVQTLVAPRMRATALALITLLPSFVGAGLGPLGVGALSDALQSWAGQESLRYAMLIYCPGFVWTAWHLWRASRTVARDVELAQTDHEHPSGDSAYDGSGSDDDAPVGTASVRANS